MSLYHIYSDLTSLGLKTSSICFSKTPLHLLLPCWKGIHSVHHSSDKESSFSPLSKYTWNEGCSCSDRCSCSSSSKLFISQVLLCIFWALSTEGWINVPNSPRVEGSTAGRIDCTVPAALSPQQEHRQGAKGMSLQHTQESQSSLPQGWAWPGQDSTREGKQNPWAGLWGNIGFSFSSCSSPDFKVTDTKAASQHHPAIPALVYGTWVPLLPTLVSSLQPLNCITDPTPLFYLWITTSSLWERFPDVFTSAKFSQGFFTKVELWDSGNIFLPQIPNVHHFTQ